MVATQIIGLIVALELADCLCTIVVDAYPMMGLIYGDVLREPNYLRAAMLIVFAGLDVVVVVLTCVEWRRCSSGGSATGVPSE